MPTKWENFNAKLGNAAESVKGVSEIVGTAAATAGNAVGSYQAGKAAANGRPINDIQANIEVSDGIKLIAVGVIAAFVLIFLKTKKK